MHIAHVACSLSAHATHTCKHIFNWIRSLGQEMKGKDMPAPADALLSVFWMVFLFLPLKSMGFCPLLFLHVWHTNTLPFWQRLFITSVRVRGPGASGTWVEGLTSLKWLCALNAYPFGLWLHQVSLLFCAGLVVL